MTSTPSNTLLVPAEAEHGQRHGNTDVDADLADFNLLLELGGCGAGGGEDGGAVAVRVGVDEGCGGGKGRDGDEEEDRGEEFGGIGDVFEGVAGGESGGSKGNDCRCEL